MIVTAWNNGTHSLTGAGYGLKLSVEDRDREFDRDWKEVKVILPNAMKVVVNINKASFWNNTCHEFISKDIGQWLISKGLAPWLKGSPPKFSLVSLGGGLFSLKEISTC